MRMTNIDCEEPPVPKEGAEAAEPIPLHARLILALADGLQWTQICATLDCDGHDSAR